jgi:uncharacterized protein (TIGR02246 family)
VSIAARLFLIMGTFGLTADAFYWGLASHKEYAGIVLLGAFFLGCIFIGGILWSSSPSNPRRQPAPDTGLQGSAHPVRGAADEHGHIHHLEPTWAPVVYSLATLGILIGLLGFLKNKLPVVHPWGLPLGLLLFVSATVLWYRAIVHDTRALLLREQVGSAGAAAAALADHGAPDGAGAPDAAQAPLRVGPGNYFEQVRAALEVGDPDWAAAAYAPDAVYYEPANPPHEGREAIRAYLNDLLKGHRDLRWTVRRIGQNGDSAIVEWTWSFRTPDGRRRISDQPGATVVQIGPSGIVYHRDYL